MADDDARKSRPDLRARLHEVPHKPGVYLMRDRLDRVVYVGKARDLRKRLASYFMPSRKATSDLKTRALISSIWNFDYHTVGSEPEPLDAAFERARVAFWRDYYAPLLERTGGSVEQVARLAGKPRQTVYRHLEQAGLDWREFGDPPSSERGEA